MPNSKYRIERDSLGPYPVPRGAYYGCQTARARDTFQVSGRHLPTVMIRAMAEIKVAAAVANRCLGVLPPHLAEAIAGAGMEVARGRFDGEFLVDAYQAGAGTSFHMNANEVIANRANAVFGKPFGSYDPIHPNDHVNLGQSTNDVFPTAMRLAVLLSLPALQAAVLELVETLENKAVAFAGVVRSGRTHLQDAVPMTVGQAFGGYAAAIARERGRIAEATADMHRLGLGATAVGTGLNAAPGFADAAISALRGRLGLDLARAFNLFAATQSLAPFGAVSAALRGLALELVRVANDLRLLASGPGGGFNELTLPAVQPGSSIMPGKVNPSVPEMVDMVAFQVVGLDAAVVLAVQAGQLELNVMMPLVALNVLDAMALLTQACRIFATKCVVGLEVDAAVCRDHALRSPAIATALTPRLGTAVAARLAQQAAREGRTVADLAVEAGLLTAQEARTLLSPEALAHPGWFEKGFETHPTKPGP